MTKPYWTLALLLVFGCGPDAEKTNVDTKGSGTGMVAPPNEPTVEQVWATDALFEVPESVFYDEDRRTLYVSNIVGNPLDQDGEGYISKIAPDGKVMEKMWATDIDAPKGMGLHDGVLYVTNISELVAIDVETGDVKERYNVDGQFLNDVAVSPEGVVYFTDMHANKIYELRDGTPSVWLEGDSLGNPNGIDILGKTMLLGSMGTGELHKIDMGTKRMELFTRNLGATDGVAWGARATAVVSDWNGRVFFVKSDGEKAELLNTTADSINSADILYVPQTQMLYVPTFADNRVVAYQLSR